jgi:N4-(beta-N-acetylglucosaminyl)-L-asparaginase
MPQSRRSFLKNASLAGAGAVAAPAVQTGSPGGPPFVADGPVVIASGNGEKAAPQAVATMEEGGTALDGIIDGVNIVENDPDDITVGYGGIPNENGVVQLDAAVMEGKTHRAGSVAALEGIREPSRVARRVMERTDHVLLVGEGAQDFARMHGFEVEDLRTDRAREAWVQWKENLSPDDDYLPPDSSRTELGAQLQELERHYGTIHCSALDLDGNLSAVTTTSGLFYKVPGRVGDSPVVGAGLYVDNEVGAAGSTGRGEANLTNLSSLLIVERMRAGDGPEEACLNVCRRIADKTLQPRLLNDAGEPTFNVRFYALRKDGAAGGGQLRGSGEMIVADADGTRRIEVPGVYE